MERQRPYFAAGPQPAIGSGTGLQKFLAGLQSGQSAASNLPSQSGNGMQQGNARPGPAGPGSGRPQPGAGRLLAQPERDYVAY